jgi:hypothetical protein
MQKSLFIYLSHKKSNNLLYLQILTSQAWLKIIWNDPRLAWDPEEWDGINEISLDASQLWIPDIVLYNGEQVSAPAIGFRDDLPKVSHMTRRQSYI